MFGCCVAGRLLQTNLQQVDDTHAIFELQAANTINHICVFLLGTVPFPDGYGATVHFFWPGKGLQLLGMLSNDKPSAIFRLRGTFAPTAVTQNAFTAGLQNANPTSDIVAVLGISVEPLEQIQAQLSSLPSALTKPVANLNNPTVLTEKILKHFFNYLSSFVVGGGMSSENMVPMGAVSNWYESFTRKVAAGGIGFLEGLSD